MLGRWQNNLQNLHDLSEVNLFLNELNGQRMQFKNESINRVKYLYNLKDVYYKENETLAKKLRNLRQTNAEISKSLEHKMDVKSYYLLEKNYKAIAQIKIKMEKNAKCIKQNLKKVDKLNEIGVKFDEKRQKISDQARQILTDLIIQQSNKLQKGLSSDKIKKFTLFSADKSHVGNQCSICMEDFEIGRNMMRLDCDGKHAFCQVCIVSWLADHKTCPLCRHVFK